MWAFVEFYEQESDAGPQKFAQSYNQCHEHSAACRHAKSRHRHEKSALTAAELQRNEEEQVGEERCESENQYAVCIADMRHEHTQDKVYFEC